MVYKHQASQLHQLFWIATMKLNPTIAWEKKIKKQTKKIKKQTTKFTCLISKRLSEFDVITGYRHMYLLPLKILNIF